MELHTAPAAGIPIRGVVFDLHATLIHDGGDPAAWLAAAVALLTSESAEGSAGAALAADPSRLPRAEELEPWASRIWEVARTLDPGSERDLSPRRHREVFDAMIAHIGGIADPLADALYRTLLDQWIAYDESAEVLDSLRSRGLRIAVLSKTGIDPRGVLARTGLAGRYDAEVYSFEVGVVKPDPAIFQIAADRLGLAPRDVLMVGDTVEDDGGAARLGMRTLILPRTLGPTHGLEQVLRLVG